MAGEGEKRAIIDNVAGVGILALEHRAHAVVEDLFRHAAQRLERGGVAPVAKLTQFAVQPAAGQLQKRRQPLAQIGLKRLQLRCPRLAWTVGRRLQPLSNVSTRCLAIEFHPARNGRNANALAMQFKDHDDLP